MTENKSENFVRNDRETVIRKAYIFLSFIPFAIVMAVQTAATTPGVILAMLEMDKQEMPFDLSSMMEIFNEKYAIGCYIAYCMICLAVFIPWYYKQFVKKNPDVAYKKALGIKPVILAVSVLVSFYFVISGVLVIADKVIPSVMENYYELMRVSSLGTNMLITVIYGYLLAPVTEELCFRGLMFGMLERSNIHYMLILFIQGLMFGIMHMNLVQGVYAFLLGVVLGYLRYKYKTVILTIGAHIIFNFFGMSVELFMENRGITATQKLILAAIGMVLAVVLIAVVAKDKSSYLKGSERTPANA